MGVSPAASLQGQSSVPTPPPSCWRGVGCSSTPEAAPGIYLGLYSKVFKLGKERGQVRRDRKQRWRGAHGEGAAGVLQPPLTCPPPKRLRRASIWSFSSFWKRGLTWSQEEEGSPLQGQHS